MNTVPSSIEQHTSALAAIDMVGRDNDLAKIKAAIQQTETRAVLVTGDGGVGKTRMLQEVLAQLGETPGVRAASHIIDLYHIQHHTSEGLARAIATALSNAIEGPFRTYELAYRTLEQKRLSGDVRGIEEQRGKVDEAFKTDLAALAQSKRVVVALDTAEKLAYSARPIAAASTRETAAWSWLLASLPAWENVVVLMAGRPTMAPLDAQLHQKLGSALTPAPLQSLDREGTKDYFAAAARRAEEKGNRSLAERLRGLPSAQIDAAFRCTGGQPVLLALIVDYLSLAGLDRTEVLLRDCPTTLLRDASTASTPLPTAIEDRIIGDLLARPPVGDVITALGRAAKGADAVLLGRLLGIPEKEAASRLSKIEELTFVKRRPQDERFFLHDEMYAILGRRVFDDPDDSAAQKHANAAILGYYEDQERRIVEDLGRIYAPIELEGKAQLNTDQIRDVHSRRQAIQTELVYYLLRQDPARGFRRYYRYMREAVLSGDTLMDLQLEAEIRSFWAERDPEDKLPAVDGLTRDDLFGVMLQRPVVRAWAKQNHDLVIQEAKRAREDERGAELIAVSPITAANLSVWEAYAYTYRAEEGDHQQARVLLDKAVADLNSVASSIESEATKEDRSTGVVNARLWRARAALALAYRVRGYFHWARGALIDAIADYQQAVWFWQHVNFKVEMATTLNDLGYALAEQGYFDDGRALVRDGLRLRRELGSRARVAMSMNTLAAIDLRQGNYTDAIQGAERALYIFSFLGNIRGAGLALITLAEAKRRYSGTERVSAPDQKVSYLRQALQHAQDAWRHFQGTGEQLRQAIALIEMGCANRDWAKIRQQYPDPADQPRRRLQDGIAALRQAAEVAGDQYPFRQVDAWVNLAWLGFFVEDDALLEEGERKARDLIPQGYWIDPEIGSPAMPRDQALVLLWPQCGKLEMLRGHRDFQEFERQPSADALKKAAHHYTLGFEYNMLYHEASRDLMRVKEEVHERLRYLSPVELAWVAEAVQDTEKANHLSARETGSGMRQLLVRRGFWRA